MSRPLVESKLHLPTGRAGAISRPRLAAHLNRGLQRKLTLLAAPAGFGKTTVLAQWLTEAAVSPSGTSPQVAWVSLDAHDDDPAEFWSYVVAALQRVDPGVGADALPLLHVRGSSTQAGVAALLNDLAGAGGDIVLALDDYHAVGSPDIHEAVTYLLEHLPGNVHLVLATRADPPFPLARMRARGELVEVRSADLRFTRDEAADYLAATMGLTLTPDDVATLADRTEGWAAALQLAGLSLQGRDDTAEAVRAFAGDDRFIVDYLADEVLARQPSDVRDFLLRTSVLARMTGALCDAVTGQSGGAARLVALERANLFVVPLDDHRHWYRYHHLFGDVLRSHLTAQHPEEVAALHLRASRWLQDDGDLPGAIEHALAAGDHDRAADLMELAFPGMARDRREPELARWVDTVPYDVVRRRPVLAVLMVGALAQVSSFATVEQRLDDVERAVHAHDGEWPAEPPAGLVVADADAYRSMPAMVQTYRAAVALWRQEPLTTVEHAERALALAPPGNHLVRAAAAALGGLAAWAMGDLAAAHTAYTESAVDMRRAGHLADILGLAITLGDLCRTQGRLGDAARAYQDALAAVSDAPGAPLRGSADMHVGLAGVLLERDDRTGAAAELAVAETLGDLKGLPQNAYRSRVLRARLAQADGDLDSALVLLDEAEQVYNGDYSPNVAPVPAARARLRLRRGELAHAAAWAREQRLAPGDELSYLREYEHITLARLLLAQHQDGDPAALEAATGLLRRLATAAEDGGRDGTLIEVLTVLAVALDAAGDEGAAQAALRRAVDLAEPEGFVRVFADEGAPVARLLRCLAQDAPRSRYLGRLAAAAERSAEASRPTPAATGDRGRGRGGQDTLVEKLSDREMDVLRLLATDLDGPDIARELHVSLNTMRTHSRNIFRKLQVTSRRAAVRQARELDLLPHQRGS